MSDNDFPYVPVSTVYLEDSFIKSGVFSVTELVRVSRSKCMAVIFLYSVAPCTPTQVFSSGSFSYQRSAPELRWRLGGAALGASHEDTKVHVLYIERLLKG